MIFSAEVLTDVINQIESIKYILTETDVNNHTDSLSKFENQFFLGELETCIFETDPEELEDALNTLLAQRWDRIRSSSMSYTRQPQNATNQLCLLLANKLSPLPDDDSEIDNLGAGEGPYFILMPSLKSHRDALFTNIHNFRLHEFVLSDDERSFIPIDGVCQRAFSSNSGKFTHTVSLDGEFPELSPSEMLRITEHSDLVKQYYDAIVAFNARRFLGADLLSQLILLRRGLTAGGAQRGGREYDSGVAANAAIVVFYEYWNPLPTTQKEAVFRKYPALRDLIGRLLRPDGVDYTDARYCVEIIGSYLDPIIESLSLNSSTNLEEVVRQKQQQFLLAAEKDNYPISVKKDAPPFVLSHVMKLDAAKQRDIMRYAPIQNVLANMLLNEPFDEPEVITSLEGELREHAIYGRYTDYQTSLIIAASKGKSKSVAALLNLGAVTESFDNNYLTALQLASKGGHANAVRVLLEHHAIVDARHQYSNSNTALHYAAKSGNSATVDVLLDHGASILLRNTTGLNPLDEALGQPEASDSIKPLLLKARELSLVDQRELLRKVSNGVYSTVLMYAANEKPELLAAVLEDMPVPDGLSNINELVNAKNRNGESIFILAAKAGSAAAINVLLTLGAETDVLDSRGFNPLHCASAGGYAAAVTVLLDNNSDIDAENKDGDTPLYLAVKGGKRTVVSLLLEKGANYFHRNDLGENVLDCAVQHHPELIRPLLLEARELNPEDQKEFLSRVNNGIYTNILMYTANEKPELLSEILEDMPIFDDQDFLNATNVNGETALVLAAKSGNIQACNALLKLDATIDLPDNKGSNPLHWASACGHPEVVSVLLEHHAALDDVGAEGNTALQFAIKEGKEDVVTLLLEKGADFLSRNDLEENALDIAIKYHPELIKPLLLNTKDLTPEAQRELFSNIADGMYQHALLYTGVEQPKLLDEMLALYDKEQHFRDEQLEMRLFFDFDEQIKPLKDKLRQMEHKVKRNSNYTDAFGVMDTLIKRLELAKYTFILTEGSSLAERQKTFKTSCAEAIVTAKPVIEKHREWAKVILKFIVSLFTFPISGPLYAVGFFSTKTDSSQKLNALEKNISSLVPEEVADERNVVKPV